MHLTTAEILDLLSRCASNERIAQKVLYTNYFSYVMSITLRYARSYEEAIEMANDGFYKVYKDVKNFSPKYADAVSSFTGWLKKVVINSSIDYLRKYNKPTKVVALENTCNHIAYATETAEDALLYKDVMACIGKINRKYSIVFNLFVIDGLSHNEIAAQLSIPVNTSKSYLFKAKQALQELLKNYKIQAYERAV